MTHDTWILIADAARARLYATRGRTQPWVLVRELAHPRSAAKVSEIVSDKPGRWQHSVGGSRSATDPRTPPKEVEAEHFARELAQALREGYTRNAFARLILVAPPHFLGLLRQCLGNGVRDALAASVDRNWTDLAVQELPGRLAEALG